MIIIIYVCVSYVLVKGLSCMRDANKLKTQGKAKWFISIKAVYRVLYFTYSMMPQVDKIVISDLKTR